jgi:hypothetical protein
VLLAAQLSFCCFLGCVATRSTTARNTPPTRDASPTLAPCIYYEDGALVFFAVNAHLARFSLQDDLIPLEIAIANRGLKTLTVISENITLRTDSGQSFPVAQPEESAGSSLRSSFDRNLMPVSFVEILELRFSAYRFVPLTSGLRGGNQSMSRNAKMARHSWTLAQIWFPSPGENLKGRSYEIWFDAPELPEPVFTTIRF